jgi:hypothetical protein
MFNNLFPNPIQQSIKKYIFELIGGERYWNHDNTIEQITKNISSPKEYEAFGKFVAEIYEAGYVRAIEEHQVALEKMGLKANIKIIEKTEQGPSIFNQKNPAAPQ